MTAVVRKEGERTEQPASDNSLPTRQKLCSDKTLEYARLAGALPTHLLKFAQDFS